MVDANQDVEMVDAKKARKTYPTVTAEKPAKQFSGKVKFVTHQFYGFIESASLEADIWFHCDAIAKGQGVADGDEVKFYRGYTEEGGEKKFRAINISGGSIKRNHMTEALERRNTRIGLRKLQDQNSELKSQNEKLELKVEQQHTELQEQQLKQHTELQGRIESLERKDEAKDQAIAAVKLEVEGVKSDVAGVQSGIVEFKSEVTQKFAEVDKNLDSQTTVLLAAIREATAETKNSVQASVQSAVEDKLSTQNLLQLARLTKVQTQNQQQGQQQNPGYTAGNSRRNSAIAAPVEQQPYQPIGLVGTVKPDA
jgi:cold shock CspA family protein